MAKYKVGDILIAYKPLTEDYSYAMDIVTIIDIYSPIDMRAIMMVSANSQREFEECYKITLQNGRNSIKSSVWTDVHFRLATKAERLLYGR